MRVKARLAGTQALGAPPLPSPYPLLVFLTFCLPKPNSLTHPSQTQPLSPLLPSSSLLGAAHASGEQLVAHSSPGRGESGGVFGSAPPPSELGPSAGRRQGDSGHKASPESLSQSERRRGKYSGAAAQLAHRGSETRRQEHTPRPAPLAGHAHSPASTRPCRSPALSQPLPALPQGRALPTGAPRPTYHPGPAHSMPGQFQSLQRAGKADSKWLHSCPRLPTWGWRGS